VGQERTVLPLLAERVFGIEAYAAALTYIGAFGVAKALTNFAAGALSERYGRKPVLVAGWLIGLPIPLLLIVAPSWAWIVVANVLLGVNQGLTWSTTVIMKIDLVGPARRGLALGLNEASGYGAVALTAFGTGAIASTYGLRPEPFFLGIAVVGLGLGISVLFVRETRGYAELEAAGHVASSSDVAAEDISHRQVFVLTSFTEPALSAASQAGMVNNAVDGLAWGLFPLLFAQHGLGLTAIGTLAAIYPAVWCVAQLGTGALSDRLGRKPLIAGGMLLQAAALGLAASTTGFTAWALASAVLGLGTAMVYPVLIAVIGDVAHPRWRAVSVGSYRFWRDAGYVLGGLLGGAVADLAGLRSGVWALAALAAVSGLVVLIRMYETHPRNRR
jgi:MFS family permease